MTQAKNIITAKLYHAPCGELMLGSFDGRLCLCGWQGGKSRDSIDKRLRSLLEARFIPGESEILDRAVCLLDGYFAGGRPASGLPLLFAGTDFQKTVWEELVRIPYGRTVSYAELARRIGRPASVRAVANACGANSISVFAPCHRVIGSGRTLTGYGGGIEVKRFLLELEKPSLYTQSNKG